MNTKLNNDFLYLYLYLYLYFRHICISHFCWHWRWICLVEWIQIFADNIGKYLQHSSTRGAEYYPPLLPERLLFCSEYIDPTPRIALFVGPSVRHRKRSHRISQCIYDANIIPNVRGPEGPKTSSIIYFISEDIKLQLC